ncbi:MAG TPA: hypothetical protein VMS60_11285 [Solirubrobacterales bacterium]|nr:hypothetical protein [Solirubrobacterales bacterium]
MPSTSKDHYREFRTALRGRDFWAAKKAAKALPGLLSLLDALELTLLAAETGAHKEFDDFAARWVARIAVEKEMPLSRMAEAVGTFQAVGQGKVDDAFRKLASYV